MRLLRWPPFWFSLAFLLYILLGALNPAAEVASDERGWWVRATTAPLGTNWPTSVTAEYAQMNAWRVLASFSAAFTLIWGLRAGLNRRKPLLLVLWSFLLSASAMGFVAILQHLSGAGAVLWHFPSSNENFWGSFFYRNQAAAFLNLALVAAGVLFFYHAEKSRQLARSGGPHFLCFLLFAAVASSVGLALSRGGILFALILSLVFLALVAICALRSIGHLSSLWAALIPLVLLTFGAVMFARYVDLEAIETRFGDIGETIESADQDARALSTRATWDMAQDRLWLGWGAGSFRYIFPMYQKNYPEIFYQTYSPRRGGWYGRKMYRYAHNDLVQFVAEYGLIGSGLLVLTFAGMLLPLVLQLNHSTYATLFLLTGITCACAHAFLDFIFNSPAYWLAFVALTAASTELLRLEAARTAPR
jgi:O-antigen ligase